MFDLNKLSEQLLLAVKMQKLIDELVSKLHGLNHDSLSTLGSDHQKIAFWINIYNAYYQILVKANAGDGKKIFSRKSIRIAGQLYSLDDIEHGILRLGKSKYSLGFFQSGLKYRRVKKLRPSKLDFRIHFALNCGAVSCPPIAFYSEKNIDHQLELASTSFIETSTQIDETSMTLKISRLFLWFYNDFGKKRGILKVLSCYLDREFSKYHISYDNYDWTTQLNNFR